MHLNNKREFQTVLALDRKSLDKNDRDQDLWARKTEHPAQTAQTLVFTKTAGRHKWK